MDAVGCCWMQAAILIASLVADEGVSARVLAKAGPMFLENFIQLVRAGAVDVHTEIDPKECVLVCSCDRVLVCSRVRVACSRAG